MTLEPRKTCRICNHDQLTTIMSLGKLHLAAYTPKDN